MTQKLSGGDVVVIKSIKFPSRTWDAIDDAAHAIKEKPSAFVRHACEERLLKLGVDLSVTIGDDEELDL